MELRIHDLESLVLGIYDVKDQLKQHVYQRSAEAFAAGDRARDAIQTLKQLDQRRAAAREAFLDGIGGLPHTDEPLSARVSGVTQIEGIRIENIVFQSRPQTYVTSNMYIPDGLVEPSAAVLFVCGHFAEGRLAAEYQSVCQTIARAGLIVLAIDPIGQGERSSYYDPATQQMPVLRTTADHEQAGAQCWPLGDGLARYFIHDIIRAVDYMCTRPEIDPARIGITGNSGGGLQTSMAMLVEPRIAAAAPATFIMSRESYLYVGHAQDAEQIWPGMTALGFDHEDLVLAMAPKPVLVLAAQYDFFPIEGTRRTVERTRRFWTMYDQTERLALFEDKSQHCYSEAMANAAAAFFAEHLLGRIGVPERAAAIVQVDVERLLCTTGGQVRGEYADARGPFEENMDQLCQWEDSRAVRSGPDQKEQALAWLRRKVIAARTSCDLNPRQLSVASVHELEVSSWLWWSQAGLFNHAYMFRRSNFIGQKLPVVIAVWKRGTRELSAHWNWISETAAAGKVVVVLDVVGEGAVTPNAISPSGLYDRFGTIHKLTTDLFWLDDSLAALRTYDVLRSIELVAQMDDIDADAIQLYGEGKFSLYAQLAKVLDHKGLVRGLTVHHGLTSIADWLRDPFYDKHDVLGTVMPGMLKYFDLPDLLLWQET